MPTSEPNSESQHPLLAEPELLDSLLDVMFLTIHKVLGWQNPGRRPAGASQVRLAGGGNSERTIHETGESADDILARAFLGLLKKTSATPKDAWGALAVTIAQNKAKDALKRAGKGLRETLRRERLHLVSGDLPSTSRHDGEPGPSILELQEDPLANPEEKFLALNDLRELMILTRELLSPRDQKVFLMVHCQLATRKELGTELGLTATRINQIYHEALARLEAHPRYPYGDQTDDEEGGRP